MSKGITRCQQGARKNDREWNIEKKKRKKNARINFSVDKMKGIGNRCVCFINEEREWCEQQRKIKTKFAVYRLLSREKEGTRKLEKKAHDVCNVSKMKRKKMLLTM